LAIEGLHTRPILGDAEALPFPGASFDLVYSFGVLHHTPGTEAAVAEVRRVLRPGGRAIIGLYHRNSWFFWCHQILIRGIVLGGLLTKGLHEMLGEIEYRADPHSAAPLVKVYTRRQVKALMQAFSSYRIQTCHVEAAHFPGLRRILAKVTRRHWLERYLALGGWFLIVTATK
jgi:ubiquinone/menaquinone biosynthesis C-methylase UbiE